MKGITNVENILYSNSFLKFNERLNFDGIQFILKLSGAGQADFKL